MSAVDTFTEYRPLLFTVAYEILGSATDADDVLQDSYLRWAEVDPATVGNPRSYLAQIVTRQALNHLRTTGRRREDYVGSWLPEPIRTEPDATEDILLAESVSMAMLLVLETLSPDERAVFVLREVFGFSHAEVAAAVGRSETAVRQTAHRARGHVQARRRRFAPTSADAQEVAGRFLGAAMSGDIQALMDLMSPDVVEISDGGGKVNAARRPVLGRERVAQFMTGLGRIGVPGIRFEAGVVNSVPSVLIYSGDVLDTVAMIEVSDGLVSAVYLVRNPDKLTSVARSRALSR
ncbi:RNA polymerase sigma-70 factor [Rhodococcus sp. NPDC058505]|uniref:RNA polymerase sigma-70 factor n=1 Tax=unclassified Rhodococcus (in: high G+C Gram-positive bacteria) TaxID=192944 RepID=UPI0036623751